VKAVVLLAGVGPGSVGIVDWLLAAPVIGPLAAQVMWRWTPWIARLRLAWLSGREGRPLDPGEHLSLQVWGDKHAGAEPRWRAFLTEQRALLSELADLEAALPSIEVPVLLLADPADQIVPVMAAQRMVTELPNARLRLISDAGHHLPRRAPGAVTEAISEFLTAVDETTPAGSPRPAGETLRHSPIRRVPGAAPGQPGRARSSRAAWSPRRYAVLAPEAAAFSAGRVIAAVIGDGRNPLNVSQIPIKNSKSASGNVRIRAVPETCGNTPNSSAVAAANARVPPARPSTAIGRGTRPDRYIR